MTTQDDTFQAEFAQRLAQAIKSHTPLPEFDLELDLQEAYRLQHEVTALRAPGSIGGVKAGVTASMVQQFFGLEHALLASLYADSQFGNGETIPYLEGRNVECEVAVIVDKDGVPKALAPAIEIVYVKFARDADMSAPSLVASNLGADLYMTGAFLPWDESLNDVSVELKRDGEVVNAASMTDALGGPVPGADWMWREARKRAFVCKGEETLLLIGACGNVVPAEKGRYSADFGRLGKVDFAVD